MAIDCTISSYINKIINKEYIDMKFKETAAIANLEQIR